MPLDYSQQCQDLDLAFAIQNFEAVPNLLRSVTQKEAFHGNLLITPNHLFVKRLFDNISLLNERLFFHLADWLSKSTIVCYPDSILRLYLSTITKDIHIARAKYLLQQEGFFEELCPTLMREVPLEPGIEALFANLQALFNWASGKDSTVTLNQLMEKDIDLTTKKYANGHLCNILEIMVAENKSDNSAIKQLLAEKNELIARGVLQKLFQIEEGKRTVLQSALQSLKAESRDFLVQSIIDFSPKLNVERSALDLMHNEPSEKMQEFAVIFDKFINAEKTITCWGQTKKVNIIEIAFATFIDHDTSRPLCERFKDVCRTPRALIAAGATIDEKCFPGWEQANNDRIRYMFYLVHLLQQAIIENNVNKLSELSISFSRSLNIASSVDGLNRNDLFIQLWKILEDSQYPTMLSVYTILYLHLAKVEEHCEYYQQARFAMLQMIQTDKVIVNKQLDLVFDDTSSSESLDETEQSQTTQTSPQLKSEVLFELAYAAGNVEGAPDIRRIILADTHYSAQSLLASGYVAPVDPASAEGILNSYRLIEELAQQVKKQAEENRLLKEQLASGALNSNASASQTFFAPSTKRQRTEALVSDELSTNHISMS